MNALIESFGPEYVRPQQEDCLDCPCCTAALCERGRGSVSGCHGLTSAQFRETVRDCPCSVATKRGTAAWRAAQLRVTLQATEMPLPAGIEFLLRLVADGGTLSDAAGQLPQLEQRGYVAVGEQGPAVTELGRTYLAARGGSRFMTPVEVLSVDVKAKTAQVVVVGWHIGNPVTVLLHQLTGATRLTAEELPGTWLEAEANCRAEDVDDVVLTKIVVSLPLPEDLAGFGAPEVEPDVPDLPDVPGGPDVSAAAGADGGEGDA